MLFVLWVSGFFIKTEHSMFFFWDPYMTMVWLKFGIDGKISSRAFQRALFYHFLSYGCFSMNFQSFLENLGFPIFSVSDRWRFRPTVVPAASY